MFPASVPLDEQIWKAAQAYASRRAATGRSTGTYGALSIQREVTGRLGEFACLAWVNRNLAFSDGSSIIAREFDRPGGTDVRVLGHGIEVKAFRKSSWDKFGPCVNANQLLDIPRHSEVIVYWTLPDLPIHDAPDEPSHATCVGWLFTSELATSGTPVIGDDWRATLRLNRAALRGPDELLEELLAGRLLVPAGQSAPDDACPSCRQPQHGGHCWGCCERPEDLPRTVWSVPGRRVWHPGKDEREVRGQHGRHSRLEKVDIGTVVAERRPCWSCTDAFRNWQDVRYRTWLAERGLPAESSLRPERGAYDPDAYRARLSTWFPHLELAKQELDEPGLRLAPSLPSSGADDMWSVTRPIKGPDPV